MLPSHCVLARNIHDQSGEWSSIFSMKLGSLKNLCLIANKTRLQTEPCIQLLKFYCIHSFKDRECSRCTCSQARMQCRQVFGNIVGDGNSEQLHVKCPISWVEFWFSVLCSDTYWVRISECLGSRICQSKLRTSLNFTALTSRLLISLPS